jgi:hypothetical protein
MWHLPSAARMDLACRGQVAFPLLVGPDPAEISGVLQDNLGDGTKRNGVYLEKVQ